MEAYADLRLTPVGRELGLEIRRVQVLLHRRFELLEGRDSGQVILTDGAGQGRVVGTGAGKELLHNDEVRQAYLGFAPATRK